MLNSPVSTEADKSDISPQIQAPTTKFIQRRNKKKERYEKVTRKRLRTINKVPTTQLGVLEGAESIENNAKVHKLPMGFHVGESDNKLYFDPSMLNQVYFTKCVDVTHDGDRIATIKLQKKPSPLKEPIQDLNSSEDGGKTELVPALKSINPMLQELQNIFKQNKHNMSDDVNTAYFKKYNTYLTHRKQLFSTRACLERKMTIDNNNCVSNEISYSSRLISLTGYDFEDFIETVLKSGIPKLAHERRFNVPTNEQGKVFSCMPASFEQPQYLNNFETLSLNIEKAQKLLKVNSTIMLYGIFTKHTVEISLIRLIDEVDSIPMSLSTSFSDIKPYKWWEELNIKERREFLKHFYPREYSILMQNLRTTSCVSSFLDM